MSTNEGKNNLQKYEKYKGGFIMKYAVVSEKFNKSTKIICVFTNAKQREQSALKAKRKYIDLMSDFMDLDAKDLAFTEILAKDAKKLMHNSNVVFNFTINVNENTSVKEWYTANYIGDELGHEIPSNLKFIDVFVALDTHKDIDKLLGNAYDSIIRERIFEELAELMQVDYDYIYDQWLDN